MTPKRQFVPAHTKTRRARTVAIVLAIAVVFAVPIVRRGVTRGAAVAGAGIGAGAHSVGRFFAYIGTGFRSKNELAAENAALKADNLGLSAKAEAEDAIAAENADLKAAMGRAGGARFTLAAIIDKPPHSVYDTLVVDGGVSAGLKKGQVVYAGGDTPIGTIAEVLPESALVRLYSAPGETTDARLSPSNTDITLVGRGGGNFSVEAPHELSVSDGTTAVTKDIEPSVLGVFQKITSDARDPFQTLLLSSPVNVNDLAYVEVRQ